MSTSDAATATPVVEQKAPSKMELARELFKTINSEEIAEGDSVRKQFIARAQVEIKLTKAGAITYYNNLRNEAKGGKLYAYGGKKAAAADAPATGETDPVATSENLQEQEHAEELATAE